jgi:hypothetical protein
MSEKKFVINPNDNYKRSLYFIKEILKEQDKLTVISGVKGAYITSKVVNILHSLKYIEIELVNTVTKITDGKRNILLTIIINKAAEFDKLYQESVLLRMKKKEEKDKIKEIKANKIIEVNEINT